MMPAIAVTAPVKKPAMHANMAISFLGQTFYRASRLMAGTADVLGGS
jgi:hypothetical protein